MTEVGKTLTSINLAAAIAMEPNHSSLLVDADLRGPQVHKTLGIKPELGLCNYLKGEIGVPDLLINPGINNFVVLPAQSSSLGSSELLTSSEMIDLVEELKSRYSSRVVLFDLPPVLVGDDVIAFAQHLDAVLVVVEDGKTQADELKKAIELLDGIDILGIVLNKSNDNLQMSYDYGD